MVSILYKVKQLTVKDQRRPGKCNTNCRIPEQSSEVRPPTKQEKISRFENEERWDDAYPPLMTLI